MSKHSDEIRNKYIKNPPEGMTADDIRHMSEDDLLDMDYFLNEDDVFDEDFPGADGIGIESVRHITAKNGGACDFTYEDGIFSAKIMLRV